MSDDFAKTCGWIIIVSIVGLALASCYVVINHENDLAEKHYDAWIEKQSDSEIVMDCYRLDGRIHISDDLINCVTPNKTFQHYDLEIGEWSTKK